MSRRDTLQLLLLSAVWGASFILIAVSGNSFPPAWVALLRLTFGALFLWTVLRLRSRSLPSAKFIPALLIVALFNNAIPFTLFALGERTVPSSIAAVLNATTPIWALLITLAVQSTRPSRFTVLGVLLGFVGVMIVVFSHGQSPQHTHQHCRVLSRRLLHRLRKPRLRDRNSNRQNQAQRRRPNRHRHHAAITRVAYGSAGSSLRSSSSPHTSEFHLCRHPARSRRQRTRLSALLRPSHTHPGHPRHRRHVSASSLGTLLGIRRPRAHPLDSLHWSHDRDRRSCAAQHRFAGADQGFARGPLSEQTWSGVRRQLASCQA